MTLLKVKKYKAKFLGASLGRDDKGNIKRSSETQIIPSIGKLDAEDGSPTHGRHVCIPGETYEIDEFQVRKHGGDFDMKNAKETEGYVIDDGETPEESNRLSQKEIRERAARKEKDDEKLLKDKAKRDAELEANAEKADTVKTSDPLPVKVKAPTKTHDELGQPVKQTAKSSKKN